MRLTLFSLLPAAALLLAGCDIENFGSSQRYKEDFHYSYTLKPGGRIHLENFNGPVEIFGWDKDAVEISGTRYAATQELLDLLKIDIAPTPDSIRIRTVRPFERRGNMGARYTLHVPRRVGLERIESSNGGIRVEGIEGDARLQTSNGGVHVAGLRGDVEAKTSNGGVDLLEFSGRAVLETSNGGIKADGVRGYFEATTSNAGIDARVTQPDRLRPIRVQTSNGNVKLTMESLQGNDVVAKTSNGSINLWLPASAGAKIRAATSNSSITTDFDVQVRGTQSKSRLEGEVGGGGPLLDLSTSNGSIKLLKL